MADFSPTPRQQKWLSIGGLLVAEILLVVFYLVLSARDIHINISQALAVLALIIFNVGVFQIFSDLARTRELMNVKEPPRGPAGSDASVSVKSPDPAPTGDPLWRPGYSFLLAVGLFAMALALHETPSRTIDGDYTWVSLMPSIPPAPAPMPTLSGSAVSPATPAPTPTPVPTPMQCSAVLSGLDTLTPGSAATYDVSVSCDKPAKDPPKVTMDPIAWVTPRPESAAVTQDGGKNYSWRFLVEISPSTLPAAVVHTLLVSKISAKTDGGTADQSSPVLGINLKQAKTIDDVKAVIASIGGALGALFSLITGLVAFLRGQTTTK